MLTDTEFNIFHPSWSDDGKKIIFDQFIDNKSSIFSVEIASKKINTIYSNSASSMSAKLFGNELYLSTNQSGNWDLLKVNLMLKKNRKNCKSLVI